MQEKEVRQKWQNVRGWECWSKYNQGSKEIWWRPQIHTMNMLNFEFEIISEMISIVRWLIFFCFKLICNNNTYYIELFFNDLVHFCICYYEYGYLINPQLWHFRNNSPKLYTTEWNKKLQLLPKQNAHTNVKHIFPCLKQWPIQSVIMQQRHGPSPRLSIIRVT